MVQCYYRNDNNPNLIRSINSGVCVGSGSSAGVFSCCFPWDQCLPSGLCRATSSQNVTNESFYTALCTDQSLQDSACQKGCNGRYRTGLRYNATNDLWACCDLNDRSCSTSTNLTLRAPAPDTLLRQTMTIVDFLPTSTATTATRSATTSTAVSINAAASSTSSSSSQSTSASTTGSSLSTGAIAGIGVGVAILVIALAGIIFWILKRRRKQKTQRGNLEKMSDGNSAPAFPVKQSQSQYGELPAYPGVVEKHGAHVVEAPGLDVNGQTTHGGGGQYQRDRGGVVHELHS